jgi:hypothetical protein
LIGTASKQARLGAYAEAIWKTNATPTLEMLHLFIVPPDIL